ncbi:1-deoxy-D-xylulose 5-phosphate reductoisomerase [Arsukibacterium ikkense]|uniref:1-deoxy-D-xylulose 5-phosphate reductoisomerase n=1 Tax=Arsukibacterium ikkense TaxID=336831 RepID=A0A0M2VCP8_9GAMM|nr:1-deoxy-D-xylulose-5-phosphate reductoisomerase [Arsukibacterium ikkense]KKO47370.1 1-deoxy-D-xylulose 5-phosphate reductoisomerase [Arsukibacterium ikkense]
MRQVVILGATGSIGCSTLSVLAMHPEKFKVLALTAATQTCKLLAQCLEFQPRYAAMLCPRAAAELKTALQSQGSATQVLAGPVALSELASHPDADIVMAAIVGAAGLLPTLAAVEQGKTVLLANKEALVMSGELFMNKVQRHGATLLPIDSEHNAIFQCLPVAFQQAKQRPALAEMGIAKLLLTGSGGPFLTRDISSLHAVTVAEAVAHPNWSMGQKISVDSATMMNKGLEFIEARWLFNCAPADIEVLIHPQSIIHSMVQYTDGSVLAQLGQPDMRTPIAHALAFPQRIASPVPPLNFSQLADFSFSQPEPARYPNLYLAIAACAAGQGATTALNAANEVAVAAFISKQIRFTDIARLNEKCLEHFVNYAACSLDDIVALDLEARAFAQQLVRTLN